MKDTKMNITEITEHLEQLRLSAIKSKETFYDEAGKVIRQQLEKIGTKDEEGGNMAQPVIYMRTVTIQNDGMSGSMGSEYEWHLDSIHAYDDGRILITCEGYDFSLDDFEMSSVIELVSSLDEEIPHDA